MNDQVNDASGVDLNDAAAAAIRAAEASAPGAGDRGQRRRASVDGDVALLAKHGFADLPEVLSLPTPEGMTHEREPAYRCMSAGFYGKGLGGTFFDEGAIIVLPDTVPNAQLQPLNRAAGIRFCRWFETLPQTRVQFDIADMAEASQMLGKDPRVKDLSPDAYQAALIELCQRIKLKREGKDYRDIPAIEHNFQPINGAPTTAPILGARMSDMASRAPGFVGAAPANPSGARTPRRVTPLMGGAVPVPGGR